MIGWILLTVALIVVAQVLLKQGMRTLDISSADDLRKPLRLARRVLGTPSILVGLALYALSAAMWLGVLAKVPLSFAFPFLGLTYVGVTLIAVVFLRERFSVIQWTGLALVLAGVLLVAVS